MKHIIVITFVLSAFAVRANNAADTVTYWVISYNKSVIIRGSLSSQPPNYELSVKGESLKNLTVSFVYDGVQPKTSSLVVKERNEVLRTVDNNPVIGPYFVVPVKELIGTHQPGVQYVLDFYYSDDHGQKDLKIGTITFIFK